MVFFENIKIGSSIKIHIEVSRHNLNGAFILSEEDGLHADIEDVKIRLKQEEIFRKACASDKHRITNHIIATLNDLRRKSAESQAN